MRCRSVLATCVSVWLLALTWSVRAAPSGAGASDPQGPAKVAAAPAKTAAPVAPPGPTADDCLACHDDNDLKREKAGTSVTVKKDAFMASVHAPLACVDCHADLAHAELPHAEHLARVNCSSCHADEVTLYQKSAHAAARAGGSDVAATCASCHGMHDIRGSKDAQSRTYHLNVAATCAS